MTSPQGPPRSWSTRSHWILAGLVATLALAIVPILLLGRSSDVPGVPGPSVADQTAPRVEQLLSYTPKSVESDLAVERVHLTEQYAEEYAELVHGTLAPQARREGISVAAEVTDVAVVDATMHTMVVLMFADVVTRREAPPDGRARRSDTQDRSRVRVTLEKVEEDWLISRLDLV